MNPYLQRQWPDVHLKLINYISDALSGELPEDLMARTEQSIAVAEEPDSEVRVYHPDVAIRETWKDGFPPVWQPEAANPAFQLAEPVVIQMDPVKHRWIEIRDRDRNIITVIEVISPANKRQPGWSEYRAKQGALLANRVNLVEIDLIRGGTSPMAVDEGFLTRPEGTHGTICVARQHSPVGVRWEVYFCPLRDPLPAFRVPLRAGEHDVPLALQPLVDQVYQNGRYWLEDFRKPITPPLTPEEKDWTCGILSEAGLIWTDSASLINRKPDIVT